MNIFKAWDSKVDLKDLFQQFETQEMTIREIARKVAERLEKNMYHEELKKAGIIRGFRLVTSKDKFNQALGWLYDFGDESKRIWVSTF